MAWQCLVESVQGPRPHTVLIKNLIVLHLIFSFPKVPDFNSCPVLQALHIVCVSWRSDLVCRQLCFLSPSRTWGTNSGSHISILTEQNLAHVQSFILSWSFRFRLCSPVKSVMAGLTHWLWQHGIHSSWISHSCLCWNPETLDFIFPPFFYFFPLSWCFKTYSCSALLSKELHLPAL